MRRCAACNRVTVWSSIRGGGQYFCSAYCATLSTMPGFCQGCVAETTDHAAPATHLTQLGGSFLFGGSKRCPTCHSIVQRHVYLALFVPIWWRTQYRVIYTSRSSYVGRRLARK
jgi:endogenous inhibitor of DNA gyrase (YacG/DUF329 family)